MCVYVCACECACVKRSPDDHARPECLTLSQCDWESVGHSPNAAGKVSDTLPMRLGKYRTLSQCSLESVGHSHNAAGRVSDTLSAAGRVSVTLPMRLAE